MLLGGTLGAYASWHATPSGAARLAALLCLLAALPAALLALRTMDPPRTALRRAVARTESAAVVALTPVTVGALGVYALLRDAF